jgi:hypothetical protein
MGIFRKKEEPEEEKPKAPSIPSDAPWSSFADAAGRQWRSGDLAGAVQLWKSAITRWDGEDEAFLRAYKGISRRFTEKVMKDIHKGVLYPCHQLAELEAFMDMSYPKQSLPICRESFEFIAMKLDHMDTDDHVVLLCMNCFYLQIGRIGWAADLRDVPLMCKRCAELADAAAPEAKKLMATGYMSGPNAKAVSRTLLIYKGFFQQLAQSCEDAVRGKGQKEIDRAVEYWTANPRDRTGHLSEALNAVSKGASSALSRSNRRKADSAIEKFIDEYFACGSD